MPAQGQRPGISVRRLFLGLSIHLDVGGIPIQGGDLPQGSPAYLVQQPEHGVVDASAVATCWCLVFLMP